MELKQGFSLGIVIIFAISMVALGLTGLGGAGNSDPGAANVPVDQPQTKISLWYAENIDANISSTYPIIQLTATTTETVLQDIEKEIYSIEGIQTVNSTYSESFDPTFSSGLALTSTIRFDEKRTTAEKVLNELKTNSSYLKGISAKKVARAKTSKEIKLTSADDETVFKEYRFKNPYFEVIVEFESQIGDQIVLRLDAAFNDQQLLNQKGTVLRNSTLEGEDKIIESIEIEVKELKKEIVFSFLATYNGNDFSELEQDLEAINGIDSAKKNLFPYELIEAYSLDSNSVEGKLELLKEEIEKIEGIESAEFVELEEETILEIKFLHTPEFASLKDSIASVLENNTVEILLETDPSLGGIVDLNVSEKETSDVAELLASKMKELNSSEFDLMQRAFVDLDSITDGNTVIELENPGLVEVLVNPGTKEGETIEFELYYRFSREKAITVNGMQK